jgi:predicted transcriptional regulator
LINTNNILQAITSKGKSSVKLVILERLVKGDYKDNIIRECGISKAGLHAVILKMLKTGLIEQSHKEGVLTFYKTTSKGVFVLESVKRF